MIHVIATITVKPGQRDAFLTEFRKLIPEVHAEQGCIEYGPTVDAVTSLAAQHKLGPDKAVIVEKWESIEALKAHGSAPHMQAYRQRVKDIVISTEVLMLEPAA